MGTWSVAEARGREQLGVVSRAQLLELGIGREAIKWAMRSGRLVGLYEGVYRFAMTGPNWYQRALGATMLLEGGCALSHSSAGFLFGLEGVGSHPPDRVDLSVAGRHHLRRAGLVIHRPRLPFLVVRRGRYPVTSLARTLLDLAGELSPEDLERALDSAHRRYRRLLHWLRETLAPLAPRHHPGLTTLRELIAARGPTPTDSRLEDDVLRALRRHGIEPPVLQYDVPEVMRVDFAWPRQRVALHADSYRWHDGRAAFDRDAAQRARLAALDWVCLSVTRTALRGDAWLTDLRKALARRAPQLELLPRGFAVAPARRA